MLIEGSHSGKAPMELSFKIGEPRATVQTNIVSTAVHRFVVIIRRRSWGPRRGWPGPLIILRIPAGTAGAPLHHILAVARAEHALSPLRQQSPTICERQYQTRLKASLAVIPGL